MSTILYILLAILMLAILIVAHEFGHFMAARLMKIDVREFSVGFGPRLLGWKSKKHETDFSVRLIPLGGYCAFFGEDDASGISKDDPKAFPNQNVWKRLFVILMGPVMNFVLAFLVALVFLWCAGYDEPVPNEFRPYISQVMAAGSAQSAGLQKNDIVISINGQDMLRTTGQEASQAMQNIIHGWQENEGPLKVVVLRGDETVELSMKPALADNEETHEKEMRIGIYLYGAPVTKHVSVGFLEGFGEAWTMCVDDAGLIVEALWGLVSRGEGLDQAAGPVGIVAQVSEYTREYGIEVYIQLLIAISINLGLVNLLPIPGLDGSRLVFGLIEGITRKKVPTKVEAIVHLTGMALLFGVLIFFTFRDVLNLFK